MVETTDPQARAAQLVSQMTLEEKAGLTSGADFWHTKGVERLGLEPVMVTDGPHGLRKQAEAGGHLGINDSVPSTCFPTAAALGSSWDPQLLYRVGEALGAETRANQVGVILGPGVNMKRSPLCGRNFEYFSEDPLVAGSAGTALVQGIQSQGVGASVKHFAANNQETDRFRVDARISQRALREIYLPAFHQVVTQAKPWTVMCSYNKVNGIYSSQNPWLLTDVLRTEWGYHGMVVSDWGAVDQRVPGVQAGLDLEMPASGGRTDAQIVAAVQAGELDESVVDTAATRVVTMMLKAHDTLDGVQHSFNQKAHHQLARQAATDGAVLLRNELLSDGAHALPLSPGDFGPRSPLVVIGEFARTPRYQGAGSSQINPTQLDTALDSLTDVLGDQAVVFEPGYRLAEADDRQDSDASPETLRDQAVHAAQGSSVVLFLGLPRIAESEGYDRTTIDLPDDQIQLLRHVAKVASSTVAVLFNGSAVSVAEWHNATDAILECWLGGQAGGSAVADLLLGTASPSGHLTETLPVKLSDVPAQLNFPGSDSVVDYGEGIFIGYRGFDAMQTPVAYPFGHGLTYTSFELSELSLTEQISITDQTPDDQVVATVSARLTNTGRREGAQVVQLYLGYEGDSRVARAPRELRGFTKVWLTPGESSHVSFSLTRHDLSYWNESSDAWSVESGEYRVWLGFSSRDLPVSAPVTVLAPDPVYPLTASSTMKEWLTHPVGGPLIRDSFPELIAGMEADAGFLELLGSMPADRLTRFPGFDVDPERFHEMLDKLDTQAD